MPRPPHIGVDPNPKWPFLIGGPLPAVQSGSLYDAVILADRPVAFWPLNESSGLTAPDRADSDPGIYARGTTLGQTGIGDGETAAAFNGLTGHVSVGSGLPPANIDLADGPLSYEAWVNFSTIGALMGIISAGSHGAYMRIDNNGRLTLLASHVANIAASVNPLSTGVWHHVVATKSGAALHLYVDGIDVTGTDVNATCAASLASFSIGSDSSGLGTYTEFFSGSIAKAAVYNYVLSAAQVAEHYSAAGYQISVSRTASDTSITSDSASRIDQYPRTATDSSIAFDSASTLIQLYRSASDTSATSDQAISSQIISRSTSDISSTSDLATRLPISPPRTTSDISITSDSAGRMSIISRSASDISNTSDLAAQISKFPRSSSDFTSTLDNAVYGVSKIRSASDTSQTGDSASRGATGGRTALDASSTLDAARSAFSPTRTSTDISITADMASTNVIGPRLGSDSSTTGDYAVRAWIVTRSASDSSISEDGASISTLIFRTASDLSISSDSAGGVSKIAAFDISLTNDAAQRAYVITRTAFDVSLSSDTATRHIRIVVVVSVKPALKIYASVSSARMTATTQDQVVYASGSKKRVGASKFADEQVYVSK